MLQLWLILDGSIAEKRLWRKLKGKLVMATLYCGNSNVDYSIVDGRIREFILQGKTLYDEANGIATDDWMKQCWTWILLNKGFTCWEKVGEWYQPRFVDWVDEQLHRER